MEVLIIYLLSDGSIEKLDMPIPKIAVNLHYLLAIGYKIEHISDEWDRVTNKGISRLRTICVLTRNSEGK